MHLASPEDATHTSTATGTVRVLGPVFFYFIAAGIATVMLGPLLPALMDRWHILDAQAGTLFAANFLGQLCGSFIAARHLKGSIVLGAALTAAGCAALASSTFGPAHLAFFAIGAGLGAGLTAGNIFAGTVDPANRARRITVLNVAWGAGAIACPLLLRLTSSSSLKPFLYLTAASLALASVLVATQLASPPPASTREPRAPVLRTPFSRSLRSSMPLAPLAMSIFAATMFLYVGTENALGGWLPSYALRSHPGLHPSSISMLFWVAVLAGRLLVAALMPLMSEASWYRLCLGLLLTVQATLCLTVHPGPYTIVLLTALAALGLAPLYPLLISFLLARTGRHAHLGLFFASACCGGATMPWLTGVLSTHFHALRTGLTVPAIGAVIMLAISAIVTQKPAADERSINRDDRSINRSDTPVAN
ncbi:MAG: MFS transporter [Acidobacteriota bacterium]|nr:MFS transporter [Acidobacteriota bacterium]